MTSRNPLKLALVLALAALSFDASAADRCVEILGTSDIHGRVEPHDIALVATPGSPSVRVGGLLVLGDYVRALRQGPNHVLLLDGGDMWQGTMASNASRGRLMTVLMSALGYDAVAIGNHEFDFGADPSLPGDTVGNLRVRAAEARFPVLSCNIREKKTGKAPGWSNVRGSTIVTAGKGNDALRVGVIGATTQDTPTTTWTEWVRHLDFVDPVPEVQREAAALRAEGVDLVVLVAHIGGGCQSWQDERDLSTCNPDDEMFTLLGRLAPGTIDVAIGGHTHKVVAHRVHGVPLIQAGATAMMLGQVTACVRGSGKGAKVDVTIHRPRDLCLDTWKDGTCHRPRKPTEASHLPVRAARVRDRDVKPDVDLARLAEPYLHAVRKEMDRALGVSLAAPLARGHDDRGGLGVAIANALRVAALADVAMMNAGGVRADLPAGPLKYVHLFEAMPFENRVALIELTGADLVNMLRLVGARGHGRPHIAGVRVRWPHDGKSNLRVDRCDGNPLDPTARLRLATNDFLARGGDGLGPLLAKLPAERVQVRGDWPYVRDAFETLLKRVPSVKIADPCM